MRLLAILSMVPFLLGDSALAAKKKVSKAPTSFESEEVLMDRFPLGPVQCGVEIGRLLTRWGSREDWRPSAPLHDGTFVMSTPTRRFGVWIEVLAPSAGAQIVLRLVQSESLVQVAFDPDAECKARLGVQTALREVVGERAAYWTDARVRDRIKRNPKTIFYLWSPRVPESWEGVEELRKLLKKNPKLSAEIVLDPDANLVDARRVARRFAWGKAYMRKSQSMDFLMRGFLLSTPTLLVYGSDGLVSLLPGLSSAKQLAGELRRVGVL